ncbi:hypothetical protein [Paracoccus ravus]|uniref:hypothetical protein n=1 Tax=Paracoccus ravus TaxID=2447760 RepID=UPI0014321751|nr:hypothetical protein [Paracoccus ravus]
MKFFLAFLSFATLIGFLAVLLAGVPRLDLFCLVGITLLLALWDTILTLREHRD